MSLLKKIKKAKELKRRVIDNYDASIYNSYDSGKSSVYLETKNTFRLVVIKFSGSIKKIVEYGTDGISFKQKGATLLITNINNSALNNNLLFSYVGNIDKIFFTKVYFSGGTSKAIPLKSQYSEKINENENIIDSGDINFNYSVGEAQNVNMKPLKNKNIDLIEGLYTKGNEFVLGSKMYVGNYHYHKKTNVFMTGKSHTNRSVTLKKIRR